MMRASSKHNHNISFDMKMIAFYPADIKGSGRLRVDAARL